jgi:hypothetical protein
LRLSITIEGLGRTVGESLNKPIHFVGLETQYFFNCYIKNLLLFWSRGKYVFYGYHKSLVGILLKQDAGVVASKPKGITHGIGNIALLSFIEGKV